MLFRRCRLRDVGLRKSFVEGKHDRCDVSTADGPFVVLLGQDGANQAAHGCRLGKMPTTSVRRLILLLRRSKGLLDQIFFQWRQGSWRRPGCRVWPRPARGRTPLEPCGSSAREVRRAANQRASAQNCPQ